MNKLTKVLGIEKPIIQAPMHTLTNYHLVSAVSKAGGLGVLGVNAGYVVPDTTSGASQHSDCGTKENGSIIGGNRAVNMMKEQIKGVRSITNKPFGIQLAGTHEDPKDDPDAYAMFKLMVEEKVPVAIFGGFGQTVSKNWVDLLHDNGIKVINRSNTPTAEDTEQAVKNGVDVIGATGFDEGGTVPTKVIGTFDIVPLVVDHAHGVPVVAAGGISDVRTVKAAFALGAQGVYIGSAFLASEEAPLAENIKQMLVDNDADKMLLYRAVPAFYRSLPGELPNKLAKMNEEGKTGKEIFAAANNYQGMINGMVKGDFSTGYASFGMGISFIHEIKPAAQIVEELNQGVPEN